MPTYLVWRWMVLLWQIIMPWLKWVSRESGHERVLHVLHAHFKPETYASSYQVTVTCTQPVQFFTVRALSRVLNHTKSEKRSVSFVSRSRTMSPPKEIWKLGEKIQLGILFLRSYQLEEQTSKYTSYQFGTGQLLHLWVSGRFAVPDTLVPGNRYQVGEGASLRQHDDHQADDGDHVIQIE